MRDQAGEVSGARLQKPQISCQETWSTLGRPPGGRSDLKTDSQPSADRGEASASSRGRQNSDGSRGGAARRGPLHLWVWGVVGSLALSKGSLKMLTTYMFHRLWVEGARGQNLFYRLNLALGIKSRVEEGPCPAFPAPQTPGMTLLSDAFVVCLVCTRPWVP